MRTELSTELSNASAAVSAWVATTQRNCDLADAHHAQAMSLCAYLLDMREYYRWQQGLPLDAALERPPLSAWIANREAHWDELRELPAVDYEPLACGDSDDPFDEAACNAALAEHGLVYGAGIGSFGRPVFFLAERGQVERRDGLEILIAGRELARGLTAPPAVSRDGRVLIRRDAMERWLWTKLEEWRHRPHAGGFAAAWAAYSGGGADPGQTGEGDGDPLAVVRRMASGEVETLILHEIGEQRIGADLGDDWDDMLEDLSAQAGRRKAEVFARAMRDLFADCDYTLPTLLERDAAASLHFWFGNLDGMRRLLAPALHEAYRGWCAGDSGALPTAVAAGRHHWQQACRSLLAAWRDRGAAAVEAAAADPCNHSCCRTP